MSDYIEKSFRKQPYNALEVLRWTRISQPQEKVDKKIVMIKEEIHELWINRTIYKIN
jgi:hypothetical protein